MTLSFIFTPWIVAFLSLAVVQFCDCQLPSNETDPLAEMLRRRSKKKKWVKQSAGSSEILQIAVDDNKDLPEELSLFVRYKNGKGKSLTKKLSRDFKKLPRHPIMSIQTRDREAIRALLDDPDIDFVELNHKVHALQPQQRTKKPLTPEEQRRRVLEHVGYGMKLVQADQMWDIPRDPLQNGNMTICIIDSGMALGHPDLPTESVTGTNTGTGDWKVDDYGHGTHCMGTIGALGNNDIGVVGVVGNQKPGFNFHIAKALDGKGEGSEFLVLRALDGCLTAGSKVISMSIGGEGKSDLARTAFQKAYDEGALLIAASGNGGDTSYDFPASFPSVMSVAATGRDEAVAYFSQYNDQVEISAPGIDIVSTVPKFDGKQHGNDRWRGNSVPAPGQDVASKVPKFDKTDYGYSSWTGTSMATPFVTGIAALVWSHFQECTNHQIRNVLIRSARDIGEDGCDTESGFGMVQAKAAYDRLKRDGCIAGDVSPQPLSDGAFGGCKQDPLYTQPPTPSPTEFLCDGKAFMLNLTTDEWGEETSWVLTNSKNGVIESADGLRSEKAYITRLCLPVDEYTFAIRDRGSDGICCNYGEGGFSLYFDGQLEKVGGNFGPIEKVRFGSKKQESSTTTSEPSAAPSTSMPTVSPTPLSTVSEANQMAEIIKKPFRTPNGECADDMLWIFTTKGGLNKPCRYLKAKPESRCKQIGKDATGNSASGYEACPLTCGTCQTTDVMETSAPTRSATAPPTMYPTYAPSSRPPTSQPTVTEISAPTRSATAPPTMYPTYAPSSRPPTSRPTVTETSSPTMSATLPPAPTTSPTASVTSTPTTTRGNNALHTEKSSSECIDDSNWVFRKNGSTKKCKFVSKNPDARCKLVGLDGEGNSVLASRGCPVTCGRCSLPRISEKATAPTGMTASPTIQPILMLSKAPKPVTTAPTTHPTSRPTYSPTLTPTNLPTARPTESPTLAPTTPCQDDKDWYSYVFFIRKDCKYLETKPSSCRITGKNGQGVSQSGYEACPVACNTCQTAPVQQSKLCNTGYEDGILLCDEDETNKECTVFVKLNGDSCNDFCIKQGGYCISAQANAGDVASCASRGPAKCSDGLTDTICTCSIGNAKEPTLPPPPQNKALQKPSILSCENNSFGHVSVCEEKESECSAYINMRGSNCDAFCAQQGATCISAKETNSKKATCWGKWDVSCGTEVIKGVKGMICTCQS